MSKTVCKDEKKKVARHSSKAKYMCKSCGVAAAKEKHLCKPKKI